MKRSEMLKIIDDIVQSYDGCNLDDAAEEILKAVENADMLKCEKRDLGSIGQLWTPAGWEPEC